MKEVKKGMKVKSVKNPVIPDMGVCDPHLRVFHDKVYMYCSHDKSRLNADYCMEDWHVWSTEDFITWTLEEIVNPREFFTGPSSDCWAVDVEEKNDQYYFYYSNKNKQTGVAVSNSPAGPFLDSLNSPILDGTKTTTTEYDPAIFTDEDGSSYIVFGGPEWAYGKGAGYFIAKLSEDMTHLAENPRKIHVDHEADDKASLNKIGGTYYLTWGSYYAVSDQVYGPYKYLGNTGASEDHGSYIEYQGQIFNSFTIFDPTMVHRASGICYVHQTQDRHLVVEDLIVEYGVGHYDANWNKIQSQWYMKGKGIRKLENWRHGFDVWTDSVGQVWYPNIENVGNRNSIAFFVSCSCQEGAKIEIRDTEDGPVIGKCEIKYTGSSWRSYRIFTCQLNTEKPLKNLHFTLKVQGQGEIRLDYFKLYRS